MKLENGKTFVIRAEKLSSYNKFIQSVKLNGKPYNSTFIKHTDIMFGGELVFEMGYKEKQWGLESQPPSSVVKNKLIPVPYFQAVSQTFTDSLLVSIGSAIDGEIRFTTDGTEPTQFSNLYSQEIIIFSNATIKAVLFVNDQASKIISSDFYQIDGKRSIEIQSQYANQYSAAGDKTLIDHLRGSGSYRTGRWQGYREDLKAVVNLGEVKEISSISMGFLQDIKSWIFYPPQLSFSVSNNGKDFKHVATVTNSFPDDEYGSFHQDYKAYFKKLEAQYIKVEATNYGLCPDWHLGAGGKTWLFSDEILVE